MSEIQAPQKRVHGQYGLQHLRPSADPEKNAKFWPLWTARNESTEKIAALETRMEGMLLPLVPKQLSLTTAVLEAPVKKLKAWIEALGLAQDVLEEASEYNTALAELVSLRAEEAALTAQMRPFQDVLHAEAFDNIVTDVGSLDLLDKYMKGSTYTQTIRMGLKGTGTAVVGDTQASHGAWLEQGLANAPTYTGNRKDVTMNAATGAGAGARSSASPTQAFAITSTGTVFGCFINNGGSATKDNTTGILFSAGDFSGGSRSVINGDTLNCTYTLTL